MSIEELARELGASIAGDTTSEHSVSSVRVTGATLRAQHVRSGDLFAALPGAHAHGADFVADALAAGAVAILTDEAGAEREALREHPSVRAGSIPVLVHPDPRGVLGSAAARIYGDPSRRLAVLGITGTSGKTTTTYLVEAGLRSAGLVTGLIGTVETRIGGDRLESAFTTPEAPDLQALLALMLEHGVTHVAMEVSSHALALGRVGGIRFAVGAFTNLSQDHLDFHHDLEDYFAAKAMLFDGRCDREIVCTDTEYGKRLVGTETTTVSTTGRAHWTATGRVAMSTGEQRFTANGPRRSPNISLKLPGPFNIANALLAAALLDSVDVAPEAIEQGLADVDVPGRMERVIRGQDFAAVVDYSHKPDAVASVLDAARAQASGKVTVVLGCGGDRDEAKRAVMGEAATRRAELLIVTDDNPRGEDPSSIRAKVLSGAFAVASDERGEVVEIGDRRAAINEAVRRARNGDVVVVAGKGHETGQEVAGVLHPFSDRDELARALDEHLEGSRGTEPAEVRQTPARGRGIDEEAR